MRENLRVFKYFWMAIRRYRLVAFTAFTSFLLGSLLSGAVLPLAYKGVIDAVTNGGDRAAVAGELWMWFLFAAGIVVAYHACFRISDFSNVYYQSKSMRDLYNYAFQRLDSHSYAFFTDTFAGSLVARVRRFVRSFENVLDRLLFDFGGIIIRLAGILVVLFITAPLIALFFVAFIIIYALAALYRVKGQIPLNLAEAAADSKSTGRLADILSNITTVKFFATEERERENIADVANEEEQKRLKAWWYQMTTFAFQSAFLGLLEIGSVGLAIWLWINGEISTGTIVLVQSYTIVVFAAMFGLGRAFTRFVKGMSDAREMVQIFETPIGIQDPEEPEPCRIRDGAIDFNDVTFRYVDDEAHVFRDFSLSIKPGERIGLVGHSGAGKSTITKLILRFADVVKGSITIDGQDIRNIRQADLRSAIAHVPQEPLLFHRTLWENIGYAKPDASEEEILEAAKKSHAHEFISKLPHGYETLVGERGIKLSGGERQRVAIARAMLRDAPILVLDEATSSLDSISEAYIQESLGKLMQGRTTIVIAHRLSTIKKMDRIVVLEGGAIAEEGTHDELVKRDGVYAALWKQQVGGHLPE